MKVRVTSYTFDKVAKTISFDSYASISLEAVLAVVNTTSQVIIYNPSNTNLGGTALTNVLTLEYDTSAMANTDDLLIYYDDTNIGATEAKQDDIINAIGSTVLAVTNAIEQIAFDLNAAPFSATTNVTNDYILDSIELNFSTTESKTITVTSSDGTILYKDTNTNQSISLVDINTGFNGGENITVAVTQFGSAGTMDCVLKVRQGTNTLLGDPSLGASAEVIGKVRVVDANGVEVTDPNTSAIKGIDVVHGHVHAGRMFTAGYYNASVLNNGTVELLIQVGANPIHMIPRSTCGGDAVLSMFTGVTFSAAGTAVTASNHLSTSAKVTTSIITHTPTITGAGTQFDGIWFLPGGTGGNASGGSQSFETELVLSPNTDYLIRLTNISGNTKPAMINVQFYEPTL